MDNQNKSPAITLPGAIIISAAIIAVALIWVKKPASPKTEPLASDRTENEIRVPAITSNDHILGNPSADIRIIEYSDPSCPFCKTFHATMVEIMDQYGPGGKVAWIYRHLPIDQPGSRADGGILHPNAGREAQSFECAAAVGGNIKFWEYAERFYITTPSVTNKTPQGLDPKQLPLIAKETGLDADAFLDCLDGGEKKAAVERQYLDAVNAGINSTPASFMLIGGTVSPKAVDYINDALVQYRVPSDMLYITNDKKMIVMNGALPKEMILGLIRNLVGE